MKKILATLVVICFFAASAFAAEPADTKQAPPPCPMMSGQQAAMGGGMMKGGMMQGGMNCPMKKNMGEMLTMLKEVMVVQDALLKGVGAQEKKALQTKLADMMKKVDDMKAAPMHCPMMQMMDHGKHQMAPAGGSAAPAVPMEPAKSGMPAEHKH